MIKLIALFIVIVAALLFVKYIAFWFKLFVAIVAASLFGYLCWRLYHASIKVYLKDEKDMPQ